MFVRRRTFALLQKVLSKTHDTQPMFDYACQCGGDGYRVVPNVLQFFDITEPM